MASATATANDFEAQTLEARVYAQRVRRSMDGTKAHLGLFWHGTSLVASLRSISCIRASTRRLPALIAARSTSTRSTVARSEGSGSTSMRSATSSRRCASG